MSTKKSAYSNPAFCQKSEFADVRRSPLGALTVPRASEVEAGIGEQEFYEEVVVDADGFITDKKVVVVAQNNEGKKYIQVPQNEERLGGRYGSPSAGEDPRQGNRYAPAPQFRPKEAKITRTQSMRYEYIQMQEQDPRMGTPKKNHYRDDTDITPGRVHRYAVIEPEEETELTSSNTRYALVPVDQLNNLVAAQATTARQTRTRYEYIQDHQNSAPTNRYDYPPDLHKSSVPSQNPSRYDYPPDLQKPSVPPQNPSRYDYPPDLQKPSVPPQSPSRYDYPAGLQKPSVPPQSPSRYDYPAGLQKPSVPPQSPSRYDYPAGIQKPSVPPQSPSRYEYPAGLQKPSQSPSRYDYPAGLQKPSVPPQNHSRYDYPPDQSPSRYQVPRGNPAATQKLHELLTTPRKSVRSPQRVASPPLSPILSEFQVKTPRKPTGAQQRLNYALGTRQLAQHDKRSTAIVAPMCSSPIQSVYSETTHSKSGSWSNLSGKGAAAAQRALCLVALVMMVSGGCTSGLCFYMISNVGRQYFLDFGAVAGFTCLVLGMLGFRSRKVSWLPNRNYISGYLVLSLLSLLTCGGLLVLLLKRPRPGTPLADIASGAVCAVAALCLLLAAAGVVSSCCCRFPPPDNRVQHCADDV